MDDNKEILLEECNISSNESPNDLTIVPYGGVLCGFVDCSGGYVCGFHC